MLATFRKILSDIDPLNRVQDNIAQVFGELSRLAFLDHVIVDNILLTTGTDNFVSHGLRRPARGYVVVMQNAQADVWKSATVNATPNVFLILKTSANVTASILFF